MQAREMSSQEQDALAGDVMESLGEPNESESDINQSHESAGAADNSQDHAKALASAKKRLRAQSMQHERELRDAHARIADMQSRLSPQPSYGQDATPYGAGVQPGSVDEQIHKAVSFALNHREMEERKAKDAASQAHVQKQYKDLYKHLDSMGDKYDDFHDVVFGDDAQYTPAMRDYAMTLPKSGQGSAGEVLYKLGQNPQELERIARLHPLDQATELAKLSHALISGGDGKSAQQSRTLGNIKTTPVSQSHVITDKTPVGSIRQRMKSGQWK